MTNGYKIRSMTDEELAKWSVYGDPEECKVCDSRFKVCEGEGCFDAMLKWLKQKAEEE